MQSLSNSDLFRGCRIKDRMKVLEFEDMFKELVSVEVYGDDIEEAWSFWG